MQQTIRGERALPIEERSSVMVGIDDGYACTKLALPDGRLLAVPSQARVGRSKISWMPRATAMVFEYRTEGSVYSVGDVDAESTRFEGYPTSSMNRAIVQHALQCADLEGCDISAVSGLPVSAFYRSVGGRRQHAIDAKRDSLFKEVTPGNGALPASIVEHEVIPEALAAWYDLVIEESDTGAVIDQLRLNRPVAIVDIGGRTTDTVVVHNQGVLHTSSGSCPLGLLDAVTAFGDVLEERFDMPGLDKGLVSRAFEQESVRLFGHDHDVRDDVSAAKQELVERLHVRVSRQLGAGAELECVLFVGGGAVALRKYIDNWFPNQVMARQPAYANARGMLKYLRYLCSNSEIHP